MLNDNTVHLPRMRTIQEAAKEIRELDPRSAISPYHIRQLTLTGVIPRVKAGKKYLINLDTLYEYLENPTAEKFKPRPDASFGGIRRVV